MKRLLVAFGLVACAREVRPPVVVTVRPSAFTCMTWTHAHRVKNACFRSEAKCMQTRARAVHASSCVPQSVASCTEFRNGDNATIEDCFSNAEQCAHFRAGFSDPTASTPCEMR